MTTPPEFAPIAGVPFQLAPDLALILAPNPSPMTNLGTNSYVLGTDTLAIIDPGPQDARHLEALRKAISGRPVSHILVTHSHVDHSPLSAQLSDLTGAPVCAFGDSFSGRSQVMQTLITGGFASGGEGIDAAFAPTQMLRDCETLVGNWGTINVVHTPGHMGNHLCFEWHGVVFTGDHVMGWASSMVSPPDGDLGDFMRSCARLSKVKAHRYYPAHGAPIDDPAARLHWLITHRKTRETEVLAHLTDRPATPVELAQLIYKDAPAALISAALRNVLAHLIELTEQGKVIPDGVLSATAVFRLSDRA